MSAYCSFAKGQCNHMNKQSCSQQSILKRCQILRDQNSPPKETTNEKA